MRVLRFGILGLLAVAGCVGNSRPAAQPVPPPSAFAHPGYVYTLEDNQLPLCRWRECLPRSAFLIR